MMPIANFRHLCLFLFPPSPVRQWLCDKVASGLERILCEEMVKRAPGKHG